MHVIRRADYTAMPWKNGAGTTLEIAVQGRQGEAFDWRLSLALVEQDCAFSAYAGYERHTALVEGAGFELRSPEGSTLSFTQVGQVHAYEGATPWECRLRAGPAWDLNLIARSGLGGRMHALRAGPEALPLDASPAGCYIVSLQAPLEIVAGAGSVRLASRDAAFLARGEAATVTAAAGSGGGWLVIASLPPAALRQNL
jgi:environmental stress-induced protein Ves